VGVVPKHTPMKYFFSHWYAWGVLFLWGNGGKRR